MPKKTPEPTQELDQNWTKKGAPKGGVPKMPQSQGLCSNLLSLAHSNETIMFCQAFTPFVNEPRFGQDRLKMAPRLSKIAPKAVPFSDTAFAFAVALVCLCYAFAMPCFASALLVLCACFALAVPSLCFCFAQMRGGLHEGV